MAKTVKFNLICDKKPVRTIEDLQKNFSVEDVLAYYDNRLLHRWLEVRGYDEELKMVSDITSTDKMDIIKELIKIFNISVDNDEIKKSVYMLQFLDERKELYNIYKEEEYKTQSVIDDYATGYVQLVEDIIQNPTDAPKIKADIEEIVTNYGMLLGMNYRELFYTLDSVSPLAILCLLMNDKSRIYFLPQAIDEQSQNITAQSSDEIGLSQNSVLKFSHLYESVFASRPTDNTSTQNSSTNTSNPINSRDDTIRNDKDNMFSIICKMIIDKSIIAQLGDSIKTFAGDTDSYWKDLEPKGKKYMIISMVSGDYVRSAGMQGGDKSSTDVNKKFVILDGIDYKSNSSSRTLVYMEV